MMASRFADISAVHGTRGLTVVTTTRDKVLAIVPANAVTHNHKLRFMHGNAAPALLNMSVGGYGPGSKAATTKILRDPFQKRETAYTCKRFNASTGPLLLG
jgi:hypothetical protein